MRARIPVAPAHDRPGLCAPAPRPRPREPAAAPPTRRPDPADSHTAARSASYLGQAPLGAGSPLVCRLAPAAELRHAGYGRALASPRLAAELALEVPLPRRPAPAQPRGARPDRHHVPREPAL